MRNEYLRHKGFVGSLHYDYDHMIQYGELLGVADVIRYESPLGSIFNTFYTTVDEYITYLTQQGKAPGIAFSGKWVRLDLFPRWDMMWLIDVHDCLRYLEYPDLEDGTNKLLAEYKQAVGFYNKQISDPSFGKLPPRTRLRTCEACGMLSTPKRIQTRRYVWGWNWINQEDRQTAPVKNILCMACWNKARFILRQENDIKNCKALLNQLKREIRNERYK